MSSRKSTVLLLIVLAALAVWWCLHEREPAVTPDVPATAQPVDPLADGRVRPIGAAAVDADHFARGGTATEPGRTAAAPPPPAARDAEVEVLLRATDGSGNTTPLPFADVDLHLGQDVAATGAAATGWSRRHRTDARGRAVFVVPGGLGRSVVARSPLGSTASATLQQDRGNELVLAVAARVWLRGRVLDVQGQPVPDADIELLPFAQLPGATTPVTLLARSDANGRFVAAVARGGQVGASHAAFAPSEPQMILLPPAGAPTETKDVTLRLVGRSAWADGSVVDAGGRPVRGARIELRCGSSGQRGPAALPRFVVSGDDGTFSAGPLRPGPVECSAIAAGHGPVRDTFTAMLDARCEVQLQLHEPCSLAGIVVSPTGQPIANATLSAHCPGTFEPRRTRSATDGSYRIDDLAPGRVDCFAEHAGLRSNRAMELRADTPATWNVVLGAEGDGSTQFSAQLVDKAGKPLAHWHVRLAWAGGRAVRGHTDPNGCVDLPQLEPVPADVFVHAPGAPLSGFADARFPGQEPSRERVRLAVDTNARASSLVGQVVADQLAEPDAEITLWHHEHREYASLRASADGSFRLDKVPAGTLDVVVRMPGHAPVRRGAVAVIAGEVTDLGTITLHAAGAVRGTVLGPDNQPPEQLELCVLTKDQRLIGEYSGGVYRIGDVPPGRHVLQVQGPTVAGAWFDIEVTAGVEVVHPIELRAGVQRCIQIDVPHEARGYVSLSLKRKGEHMSWYAGQVVGSARSAEFVACMAPGDYEVFAWTNGHHAKGTVTFAPGDAAPVQFVLTPR